MEPYLFAIPWLGFIAYVAATLRIPRPIAPVQVPEGPNEASSAPPVTVVVPARNESVNIQVCVGSLSRSSYPDFEIVVVDDRSEDGTGDLVRAMPRMNARDIRVVTGKPLPEGWLGKPWACHQGADSAGGGLLLFTDADTTHAPELLARAVASLREDGSDAVTLVGRQLLGSFWEYLLQPQMFGLLALRYPNVRQGFGAENWGDAIANGQYILIDREAYEAVGGHASVRAEVVEDMRLAQVICRSGHRLSVRGAEDHFATRMYRSLPELVEGWGKNLYVGSRQSMGGKAGWLTPFAPAAMIATLLAFWVAPMVGLVLSVAGFLPGSVVHWGLIAYGLSTLFWVGVHRRFRAPLFLAPLHPLGALGAAGIILRSWRGGSRVRWKGREYQVSTS